MELIEGEPIDEYCRRQGLALPARLELFRQVCAAVHFAHKSLVLHRDIKPSNILVTADGVPKLLDFGIAKLVAGEAAATAPTLQPTRTGVRLLTPEWASPEQIRGELLTTASDVYSLGLLLYLLVAGRRAYEIDRQRPAELERIVCEVMPPPPRAAEATGAFARLAGRWAPGLLAPQGDLEVVVMAALRKEPARRYASAEQLGEDVRRYLADLPVAARKDSLAYRAGVFVRRHRWAVLLAAATFAALLLSTLVAISQAREARDESLRAERNLLLAEDQRKQADDQRRRAEQVAALLDRHLRGLRPRRGPRPLAHRPRGARPGRRPPPGRPRRRAARRPARQPGRGSRPARRAARHDRPDLPEAGPLRRGPEAARGSRRPAPRDRPPRPPDGRQPAATWPTSRSTAAASPRRSPWPRKPAAGSPRPPRPIAWRSPAACW